MFLLLEILQQTFFDHVSILNMRPTQNFLFMLLVISANNFHFNFSFFDLICLGQVMSAYWLQVASFSELSKKICVGVLMGTGFFLWRIGFLRKYLSCSVIFRVDEVSLLKSRQTQLSNRNVIDF